MDNEVIEAIEAIPIRVGRDVPYLGRLEDGVHPTDGGYFVRPGNKSVYHVQDQSLLVKVTTSSGAVGWGECVAFIAPAANAKIVNEVLGPLLVGRSAHHPAVVYEDLYDLMRVRGFFGGYYHDCLAAIDIALWDVHAKLLGRPLADVLGGVRTAQIPAYVSGLPKPSVEERVEYAVGWREKGFKAVKFASAISHEGCAREMASLRKGLGDDFEILCDMHWKHSAPEAIRLINRLGEYGLRVAEAPCRPEDVEGQARVAESVGVPVGIGEELRTVYEYLPPLERRAIGVAQPELGRTGVTSFMRICGLTQAFHVPVMPHASIGIGLFQAASLHATATLADCPYHEYQHSIFDKNLAYVETDMRCENGFFHLPTGPGLGVEPNGAALACRID